MTGKNMMEFPKNRQFIPVIILPSKVVRKLPDRIHTLPDVLRNVQRLLESIHITTTPVVKYPEQYIVVFSTLVPVLMNIDALISELVIS